MAFDEKIQIHYHDNNLGKGAAIHTALKYITGDITIIQDADLEYDPYDYNKLLEPIFSNKAKVVYGSRVLNQNRYETSGFTSKIRIFGNHSLTIISVFRDYSSIHSSINIGIIKNYERSVSSQFH